MQKLLCLPCRPMFNSNRSHYTPLNSSITEPSPCSHLLWLADCREVFPGKDVVRNSYSSFPLFNFFLLCFPPQDPLYHFASSILFTLLSVSFFIHLLQLPFFFFLVRLEQYQLTLILFFPHTYLFLSSDCLSLISCFALSPSPFLWQPPYLFCCGHYGLSASVLTGWVTSPCQQRKANCRKISDLGCLALRLFLCNAHL